MKKNIRDRRYLVFIGLVVLLLFSVAFIPYLYGPGIKNAKPMGAYLNGIFPSSTPTGVVPDDVSYDVENAFPNLTFIDPVDMLELPGGNEFLVMGLQGHIWKFENNRNTSSKQQLLDISDNVVNYADGGMLGMVLHPEYGQTGSPNSEYIYVFYRYTPVQGTDRTTSAVNAYMRLSRFDLPLGASAINPSSEEVLINVFDRHDWHNGGDMFFGPNDGFLYLVVGDEGGANDSYNVTQQINKWLFGGVLRIDVDQRGGVISHPIRKQPLNAGTPPNGWPDSFTQGYFIPNDNPWLDAGGGILEEFYAIGTRSPHRMTFDPPTGDIWIGDIGQAAKEEISLVRKGDNLQWPYREGDQNGPKAKPDPLIGNDRPPIHAYGRTTGRAVIGGFVYRGSRYPELQGKYLFGDHETQNVWTLNKTAENSGDVNYLLNVPVSGAGGKDGISSFFTDSDDYVYILDLFGTAQDGGVIRKIVRTGAIIDPPQKLSDLNVFTSLQTLNTVDGVIPYDVNAPLWSDGALKRRWIALPNNGTHNTALEQIDFEDEDNWSFPAGTVAIKHFELPTDENDSTKTTKLETRFLVFTEDDDAYAVTYKWNDEQTDAFLIDIDEEVSQDYQVKKSNGSVVNQTWNFPSRSQCVQCHTSVAGYALGLKTRQLNKSYTYSSTGITSNQLETWDHLNMFDKKTGPPTRLPASANINSTLTSDEMKVRSYIDANCAFCHRPNGVQGAFDGRALKALYDQSIINTEVVSNASVPGSKIVVPQDVTNSMLHVRDGSTSYNRMPPIGRNLVDEDYMEVLTGWIEGLDVSGPETIQEGVYTLQARHSDKYLAVENASNSNNARVVQVTSNLEDNAQWNVESMGNKKYRIIAKHSDMVLSLRDLRTDRGVNVIQETWNGGQHQLWYFEDTNEGYYRIINAYNSLEINVFGGSTNENRHTILWSPGDAPNQQWKLSAPVTSSDFMAIGETGKARANHQWTTVDLDNRYDSPVVVAGAPTYEGNNQSTVRIQNITANSFQIRIDEWECLDEWHLVEEIPYMVVEAGIHELPNGKIMQAGNIDGITERWYTKRFDSPFDSEPIVFGQATTENEPEAVSVSFDERNVSRTQMRLKLKEQDGAIGGHAPEQVSWIAVEKGAYNGNGDLEKFESGNSGRGVNHNWRTLGFNQQYDQGLVFIGEIGSEFGGDADALRYRNLTNQSVQVIVEEEKCGDAELKHTTEEVHFMVFNSQGDVMGKTLETSQGTFAVKADLSRTGFYFNDLSTLNKSHLIDIEWTTSNDKEVAAYIVERSIDGHNFTLITDQPALKEDGLVKYDAYDSNPVVGRSLYRIMAIKQNNEKEYSHSVEVDFDLFRTNVLVYPNPVDKSQILTADITVSVDEVKDLIINIYTTDGRLVRSQARRLDRPQAFVQFDVADLKSGVYMLKVMGSDFTQTRRFVVR